MGQTEQTGDAAQPKPSSQTASPAQPGQHRSGQARPQPSPALAKAVPKAFSYRIQIKPSLAQPRPAQPKPSSQTASPVQPDQHRSGQARPGHSRAQPSPSRGVGLAKALPKAFSYRIQRSHSRPPERSVFAPFLAGLGPPCRCVSLFWSLGSGASFLAPAQPSPAHTPAQPSPGQASLSLA